MFSIQGCIVLSFSLLVLFEKVLTLISEMRRPRLKRMLMICLSSVSIFIFYRYFMWQLEMNSVFPVLISSSQKYNLARMKHAIFSSDVKEGSCLSSWDSKENITISQHRVPISNLNIDSLIKESGLNLGDAFVSDTENIFSDEAMMISGLPHFTARIPAVVFHKNVFLAFCEARFEGFHDFGEMMIAMRRGVLLEDGDVAWQKIQLIAGIETFRTMNPSPVVDLINDAVVLVFATFPSSMSFEQMMSFPSFPLSKLYVMTSYDLGVSWSEPNDITLQTILKMNPNPVLLVPGPGHSIQMKCGRIIVPVNYFTQDINSLKIHNMCKNCTNYNRIIYSDDGGITWSLGKRSQFTRDAITRPIYLNEVQAVEVEGNTVCLNSRTLQAAHPRAISLSMDGGKTLSKSFLAKELIEPGYKRDGKPIPGGGCAGSVIGFDAPSSPSSESSHARKRWVLFSNPAHVSFRVQLSLRLSIDGCRTWSPPWKIFPFKAAYSDLTYFESKIKGRKQHLIAVLFEGGYDNVIENMKLKIFNLEAVLSGIKSEIDFPNR